MLDDTPRLRKMADKLQIEIDNGRAEGEFVESFVPRVRNKLKKGWALTEKEITKLEELFEQY
jgi:hypothetical protein